MPDGGVLWWCCFFVARVYDIFYRTSSACTGFRFHVYSYNIIMYTYIRRRAHYVRSRGLVFTRDLRVRRVRGGGSEREEGKNRTLDKKKLKKKRKKKTKRKQPSAKVFYVVCTAFDLSEILSVSISRRSLFLSTPLAAAHAAVAAANPQTFIRLPAPPYLCAHALAHSYPLRHPSAHRCVYNIPRIGTIYRPVRSLLFRHRWNLSLRAI